MSFATLIKNEITKVDNTKSESIAELSGFISNNAEISQDYIRISIENASTTRRIFKLIKDLYDVSAIVTVRKNKLTKRNLYILTIKEKRDLILKDLSLMTEDNKQLILPKTYIISDDEEKKAYLRGAFLSCGSINDPKTARYHLEFIVNNKDKAIFLNNLLNEFNLNSKIFNRHKGYMVYIKEAEKISDFLRMIKAFQAVLYFEDIRIYRDHKNMTNRLNNCEQANIDKLISSAEQQLKDINLLKEHIGLELLDDKIREVCEYRLKYPETSLLELSEIISLETGNPITKSGLYHRFRKIKEMANKIKNT